MELAKEVGWGIGVRGPRRPVEAGVNYLVVGRWMDDGIGGKVSGGVCFFFEFEAFY